VWAIKNIPSFKIENYTTSSLNYYKHTDNVQSRTVKATVDKDGNLQAIVKRILQGYNKICNIVYYTMQRLNSVPNT
jgi:hypothetical protein